MCNSSRNCAARPFRDSGGLSLHSSISTIGSYGPLSIHEGTDPAWIEAAEKAYRSDEAAARQQRAIPLADGEDYGDEFADEEVPF